MINYKELIGSELAKLTPYLPGKPLKEVQRETGIVDVIKLASNENPIGPSPKAIKALNDFLPEVTRYPIGDSYYLRKAISEKYNVPMENILCGAGSDEIIQLLYMAFLHNDKNVIAPTPSFSEYYIVAKALRANCTWVKTNSDLTINFDNLLNAININTRFIMLANPNNPTGLAFTKSELKNFLDSVRDDVIVVMDEAYLEFADCADMPDSIAMTKNYKNLVVLRTFSKAYGLASMRCGFIIADAECIDMMQRVRQPFNVNMAAQVMAEAALSDEQHLKLVLENNRKGKEYIYGELKKMNLPFIPTQANFLLINVGNGKDIFQRLLKHGVIVRFLSDLPDYIRVSIGTDKENQKFIEILRDIIL